METGKIEILLIELAGASIKNKLSWRHSVSRQAPLGLYCLRALSPQRISIIDVPVNQVPDMLSIYSESPLRAVICRLPEDPDTEKIKNIMLAIRKAYPKAKIACNYVTEDIIKEFDFVINGTGKTSVLRILRGDVLVGYCDDMKNDMISLVDVPTEPLVNVGYDLLPEKWLSVHDIEVFQPWLGLTEFSSTLFAYPGLEIMTRLLNWLKASDFDAIHFNPNKWTVDDINRLRTVILKLNLTISISFLSIDFVRYSDILAPIKSVWLHNPQASRMDEVVQKLKEIREAGFEASLQIDHSWFGSGTTLAACRYIDHLVISDEYNWNNIELKKFTQRFWGAKSRFFRRLFGLRTAAELIVFMKNSYALLDTLFLPDEGGR